MAKFIIETHQYAPELNKVHFIKGGVINADRLDTIRHIREYILKPITPKRLAVIVFNTPLGDKNYSGRADSYQQILEFIKTKKEIHNLPGTTYKVTTKLIG